MGSGNFNAKEYKIQAEKAKVSTNSGFDAESMCDEFNPSQVQMRFSKKGPFNEFRDVITVLIGLDVTGSMDIIPKALLTGSLGSLMLDLKKTFNRPNENLQLSFAGIGDAKTDESPLQVTHFESDNRFAQHLPKIWLEGHGGANGAESYNLLWWYAANKTHLNYVQHDQRKGILITIGDDNVHSSLTADEIQMWLEPGYDGGDISNQVLLNAVREQYDVYHIVVTDGNAYFYDFIKRSKKTEAQIKAERKQWETLLGPDKVIQCKSDNVANAIADIVKRHRPVQDEDRLKLTDSEWSVQNMDNLSDEQWKEVLSYTLCPLTREFMEHPVVWGDNKQAYERAAVESYIKVHQQDPITQERLTTELILKPNVNIAQVCLNYKPYFDKLSKAQKAYLVQLALPLHPANNQPETSSKHSPAFFLDPQPRGVENEEEGSNLQCPITHEIMIDPVILVSTGHTFDREAITEWFEKNDTDPLSGEVLENKAFVPNFALKGLCDDARAKTLQNH